MRKQKKARDRLIVCRVPFRYTPSRSKHLPDDKPSDLVSNFQCGVEDDVGGTIAQGQTLASLQIMPTYFELTLPISVILTVDALSHICRKTQPNAQAPVRDVWIDCGRLSDN